MKGNEEQTSFEIGIVVSKKEAKGGDEDCVEFLVLELKKVGLIVERVLGLYEEFIKVAAPLEILGRAAVELEIKKPTHIGMDLQFEWDEDMAFVRQPDGSLFSWCERFRCFTHLIYGIVSMLHRVSYFRANTTQAYFVLNEDIKVSMLHRVAYFRANTTQAYFLLNEDIKVNKSESVVTLTSHTKEIKWKPGESLLEKLEAEGCVKQVFPLHDEIKRKQLLRNWALNWMDCTQQPIDEIYSYFGTKIATYFAFLGMYTRWMFYPAAFGLTLQLVDFGSWQLLMLPIFFIFVILWAVMFFQFWKRKNSALLARWQISYTSGADTYSKYSDTVRSSLSSQVEHINKMDTDKATEKAAFQRDEWLGHLLRFRNDAVVILSIICLQLPFELAYAHLYELMASDIMKFGLTALYIFTIQYLTKIGGKVSVKLIRYERNKSSESSADSLIYKVFGLYFMQSYIGVFYHALLHRNFMTLRQVLTQRLIVSQVFENLLENSIPYLKYSFKKYRTVHKKKHESGSSMGKVQVTSRVEKEYLKPSYSASIGDEFEDGLFDDFLEIALQFGMITMFACAFPLAFCFAALNNITEIRTDALKLLAMLRRPTPRASATIGAWLNIFQFLIVTSICTNCVLLVCLYDQEGKWKVEPGLAAILIMEHVLLLIKFGFSKFVPEEPAWVKAKRVKNATQAQNVFSKQLLRSISGERKRD